MMFVVGAIGHGRVVIGRSPALWKPTNLGGNRSSDLKRIGETIANM